jgi:hypothetical protein
LAGVWKHHELFDGTYTFADLMDVHEMLDVKEKNEADFHHWKEARKGA